MTQQVSLIAFERVDSLLSQSFTLGSFETSSDPVAWIRHSNVLLDACIDAIGYENASRFPCAEECAAWIITQGLLNRSFVVDELGCEG